MAVHYEFLLHKLAAGTRDERTLQRGAPYGTLAIRQPDGEDAFSLLMLVRRPT